MKRRHHTLDAYDRASRGALFMRANVRRGAGKSTPRPVQPAAHNPNDKPNTQQGTRR